MQQLKNKGGGRLAGFFDEINSSLHKCPENMLKYF
jgi:hypothetical protein